MTHFIQLHLLTAYPPSNLNRDDLGRPKTATMGGVERLRISSQSIKRAWRTSELFESAWHDRLGTRTRRLGRKVYDQLRDHGMNEKKAFKAAQAIADVFGKLKSKKGKKSKQDQGEEPQQDALVELDIEQLAHVSHHEQQVIDTLIKQLAEEERQPSTDELKLLRKEGSSVDIALFGRMLASSPTYNIEAACQVSHPISVAASVVEDDFFSAVDDLNTKQDDAGAGHIGEQAFGSALYYTYVCLSTDLLKSNLGDDPALAARVVRALTEVAVKVSPTGKQNSFASRAYASYVLAECGSQQPRSLAVAFYKPVTGKDQLACATERLAKEVACMDKVYGPCADHRYTLDVEKSEGTWAALLDFVSRSKDD